MTMYPIIAELDKLINLYNPCGESDTADIAHEDGRTITVYRSIGRHNGGVRLFYRLSDSDGWLWLTVVQDLCADNGDDHAMIDDGRIVHPNDLDVWTQFHACIPSRLT
jgi:hypothetical protein